MINLIPREERKKIDNSFYYKLGVLFVFVLSFSVFVFFIAILPSYFLSFTKVSLIQNKLSSQKADPAPVLNDETTQMIKDINHKLDLVQKAEDSKFLFSEKVIVAILLKKAPQIKITEIFYSHDPAKGPTVSISGTAPSREILLAFRQALEDDISFRQVNLPISNFVRGTDIQFNLTLIPS